MKVKTLFKSARNWTQGNYATRGRSGVWLEPTDPKATRFCLMGALIRCYPSQRKWADVQKRLEKHTAGNVVAWNDAPKRTFAEVKALVEKLDI